MEEFRDCDMRAYTSFKAGGTASVLLIPQSVEELRDALAALAKSKADYIVMGNGSNILIKDSGYSGTIIKLGPAFSSVSVCGDSLKASAGTLISAAAKEALTAGLTGLEFASGIPGSIGGAVFMNAGAYDQEMKQIVESVDVISRDGSKEYQLSADELGLSYRHSVFQETGDIILSVTLKLSRGDAGMIREHMQALAVRRNSKQPVSMPSAGSFFKRPEGYFAGKLIQDAGLKGLTVGGAQVSPLHAGFIVNKGNATASDIIDLMKLIQYTVHEHFGVMLEPEVRIIGD